VRRGNLLLSALFLVACLMCLTLVSGTVYLYRRAAFVTALSFYAAFPLIMLRVFDLAFRVATGKPLRVAKHFSFLWEGERRER